MEQRLGSRTPSPNTTDGSTTNPLANGHASPNGNGHLPQDNGHLSNGNGHLSNGNGHIANGHLSNGQVSNTDTHLARENGPTKSLLKSNGGLILNPNKIEGFTNGSYATSKDELTEEYLRRVVPSRASDGGKLVRDILVARQ